MPCECEICKNNKQFEMPDEIIEAAVKGDLVLFCGAGISTENKNVLPFTLYDSVRDELGICSEDLSFCQLMSLYCKRPNGRKKLLRKIIDRFQYIHSFPEIERLATSFHDELAEIYQIQTIITTNWDTYFEQRCGAIPITIPEDFSVWDYQSRYVIKIHGSISNLSTIIATENDYKKNFTSLQKGAIGASLKTILATKTVVFVGYSFGDDDLKQIIRYLRKEMKDVYPQVYYVTLDESLERRIGYKNATSIITAGTFFIHKLKLALIDKGEIVNCKAKTVIPIVLDNLLQLHSKVSEIDLMEYPSTVYTLMYQDGLIHSLERFLQNLTTGEYNDPKRMKNLINGYIEKEKMYHDEKNYCDESYCEGYVNGLVLISSIDQDDSMINDFPYLYLPNAKEILDNYDTYTEELKRVSNNRSKYHRYAVKCVKQNCFPGLVIHHRPLL